ncbi:PTS sugar transporter subunit IIA [Streptococcus cuniculi]|uniref:PTS mannose transporter subunit IIAB n=1 Tax=Streptococcus cuniculi TaxID=1432788 RepID=A0A4Y9J7G1_9STRE|nr:fructose PTS transporter subunit IIA [Streptococcus cuniculi]MBF0779238.1 PTS sugar transporter subunit IIA [Streptococcus cuniculi]TFU96787.1 PTS mannose transporter subunit IIAB [Streptococcus cuniculi]
MSEMSLKEVVHKELMVIQSASLSKDEVIHELGTLLYEKGYVTDANAFIDDVYLREEEGVTGIGQGIAIPHGKSMAVNQTTIAIAVLKEGIEWETLDGKLVKVIIMFAVKEEDADITHILLLQKVAMLLAHDEFIEQLVQIKDKDILYDLLTQS